MKDLSLIFLLVIDCGRQDYLYGSHVDTPNLDALREGCTVFTNAFSQANNTIPSHNSIFLSRFPCDHAIYNNYLDGYFRDTYLPLLLNKQGWKTRACSGITFFSWILGERYFQNEKISWMPALENPEKRGYGLRKFGIIKSRRNAKKTVDRVISILNKQFNGPEFFLLHLFDTHLPYYAPKRFTKKFHAEFKKPRGTASIYQEAQNINLFIPPQARELLSKTRGLGYFPTMYKASLEYIDYQIGRLISFLKAKGLWEQCLFVVTSDHGENLTENGVYCAHWKLFDETTKVPLFWWDPASKRNKEIEALVQHVDIYPSILDRLNIECTHAIRGKSLYPLIQCLSKKGHTFTFTEHANAYQYTIRTDKWQYIWKNPEIDYIQGPELEEEYLIDREAESKANLASRHPKVCKKLRKMGEKILSSPLKTEVDIRESPEAVKRMLRGLGYTE